MHVPAAMNTVTKNMTMNMVVPAVMTMTMKDTNTKNTTMSMAAPAADTITNMTPALAAAMTTTTITDMNTVPVDAADMTTNTITDMNTAPADAAGTTMDMITTTKAMTTGMITAAADVAAAKRWRRNITTTLLTRKWKNTKTMRRT